MTVEAQRPTGNPGASPTGPAGPRPSGPAGPRPSRSTPQRETQDPPPTPGPSNPGGSTGPGRLAEVLDTLDLMFRSMQVLDARELRGRVEGMRLTYALDLGRRAVAELQSPARRDLVDSGADPTAIARSGGPAHSTRVVTGECLTPGYVAAAVGAVATEAEAVAPADAGSSSGRDGEVASGGGRSRSAARAGQPPLPGAGSFSLPQPPSFEVGTSRPYAAAQQ